MKFMWLILLLGLLIPSYAHSESSHEELLHFTAHAGAAFAITIVSDQIYNKFLGWSPGSSLLGGLTTSMFAGSLYKLIETGNPARMGDGIIYNGIGAFGAIGTIFIFDLNIL